jgi:hypothetical protein
MQIDYYWQRQRRRIVKSIVTFVAICALLAVLQPLLRQALPILVDKLLLPERASAIQLFATIGNLLVGAVLVVITAFYAWITRATLRELIEARRSARRPMPLLVAKVPALTPLDSKRTKFATTFELTNTGAGTAVRPVITIILPRDAPESLNHRWLEPAAWKRSTDIRDLPTLIVSGVQVERDVAVSLDFQIPQDRLKGFMQAFLVFEDADRNSYQLLQEYDLLLLEDIYIDWQLIYERLTMRPVRGRTFLTPDHGPSEWVDERDTELLYERAGFP